MPAYNPTLQLKLDNVLVATDFSAASKMAVLYATSIARRYGSKLFVTHVVSSRSEKALMDGWRAGQAEITGHLLANRLDGIQYELLVRSGDIWAVLSHLITEYEIDLVVVGTRGRTGVLKFILGSVAQSIFRRAPCPVLTVGPSIADQDPEMYLERILNCNRLCSSFPISGEVCVKARSGSAFVPCTLACGDRAQSGIR
jgi:universal stress protein A